MQTLRLLKRTRLTVLALVIVLVVPAFANLQFFSIVQRACSDYRVTVSPGNMTWTDTDNGNDFSLYFTSRRSNGEEALIYTYKATGTAMAQTGLSVHTVTIAMEVPRLNTYVTSMSGAQVDSLRNGLLTDSQFLTRLFQRM